MIYSGRYVTPASIALRRKIAKPRSSHLPGLGTDRMCGGSRHLQVRRFWKDASGRRLPHYTEPSPYNRKHVGQRHLYRVTAAPQVSACTAPLYRPRTICHDGEQRLPLYTARGWTRSSPWSRRQVNRDADRPFMRSCQPQAIWLLPRRLRSFETSTVRYTVVRPEHTSLVSTTHAIMVMGVFKHGEELVLTVFRSDLDTDVGRMVRIRVTSLLAVIINDDGLWRNAETMNKRKACTTCGTLC